MNKKLPYISKTSALVLLSALMVTAFKPASRAAGDDRLIAIVADDTLKFNVKEIDAFPGEKLHVRLTNQGTMPKDGMGHNWILLDSEAIAGTYAMTAISARGTEYKPKALDSHVLAAIPLLGPKEVGDVTFTAPTTPGRYPYICSCSGHSMAGMKGVLVVK